MIGAPLLLLAALALPQGDAPAPLTRPVSTITFHGWSPDSTRVGWTLERSSSGKRGKNIWYLKETLRTSHGKARLRKVKVPGDVKDPGYYHLHDFKLHDLPTTANTAGTLIEIPLRYDRTLVLELKVEDKIRLYYWFEDGVDRLLLGEQFLFYVGVQVLTGVLHLRRGERIQALLLFHAALLALSRGRFGTVSLFRV